MGYLEWGSRMVLPSWHPGADAGETPPMPRWARAPPRPDGAPVGAGRRLALTVDTASAATREPSLSAPLAAGRQHVPEGVDPVADDAVHAEVEQPRHLVRVVNGPDVHLFAQPVCG